VPPVETLHSWELSTQEARDLQLELAACVDRRGHWARLKRSQAPTSRTTCVENGFTPRSWCSEPEHGR
jgi:hypothetical protein